MSAILLISPEPWDAHTVSKHHYAMTLAGRGQKVFFLNPPDDSLAGITIHALPEQPNLQIVDGPKVAKGLRFFPALMRRWLESGWLSHLEHKVGTNISTIWLFENSRFFDMRFAGDRLKIYHQVDLNQDFHPEIAAATADICFCTTDFIRDRLLPHNSRTFKIHHGVAEPRSAGQTLTAQQQENFLLHPVNVAYIGNIDISYLDVTLLLDLVRSFPEIGFHFVGQYRPDGQIHLACQGLPNVVWWGRVASELIPAIIGHCDVLLVTYLADKYREQLASPHKIMEYLASGKTVVATYTDEYKDKRHLLEMAEERADFLVAFRRVVNNLGEYNNPINQAARIEFAMAHTYEKQVDLIYSLLEKNGLLLGS